VKHKEFESIISNQASDCLEVLKYKGEEYASIDDRLHNFRVGSEVLGVSMRQVLAGMMIKHTTSIYDMCMDQSLQELTTWVEKITDHINYLLILKAVVIEEGDLHISEMKKELARND